MINRVDKKLATKSPLGFQSAKNNICALEVAKNRYLAYGLPEHHPTLVRLEHKLSQLKHQVKDEAGAKFAEQVWFWRSNCPFDTCSVTLSARFKGGGCHVLGANAGDVAIG